ncbi:MAG TPA: ATP-binding cassette domain-containing protein, partial [Ramlibacter sp.]
MSTPIVEFRGIRKWFTKDGRRTLALDGASLAIEEGQFVSVVGPSGCGKSTLLNLAAGLSPVSEGEVLYRGKAVEAINTSVGYITQRDNLLPWATVYGNIVLGLKIRRVPEGR